MKLRSEIPDIEGVTAWLNSVGVTKEQLLGKPTIFHFWSISCSLCKEAMPELQRFLQQYKNVNVIAVHMPRSEGDLNLDAIQRMVQKLSIEHPVVIDNKLTLSDAFNNQVVPSYYVFDRQGILRHYQAGNSGMKLLQKRMQRISGEI